MRQFIIPYFNFVFLRSALAYEMVNPALPLHGARTHSMR